MSIVYMDGFDRYATDNQLLIPYYTYGYGINNNGYNGGRCIYSNMSKIWNHICCLVDYSGIIPLSGIVGFWYKQSVSTQDAPFFCFRYNLSANDGGYHLGIRGNLAYPFAITTDYFQSQNVSSNISVAKNSWYHIEFKYQLHISTTMPCELRINGMHAVELPTGSRTITNSGEYYPSFASSGCYIDHFYILDFNGSTHNDFIGPYIYITGIDPTGNGDTNNWTSVPSTGSNYDMVNDDGLYDSDSRVYATTSGSKELYKWSKFTESVNTIHAVQMQAWAGKSGLHNMSLKYLQKLDGVEYLQVDDSGLGPIYQMHQQILSTNPATSLPWTTGDLGNNQFGFELWSTGV